MKTSPSTLPARRQLAAVVKKFSLRFWRLAPVAVTRSFAAVLAIFAVAGFNPQALANTYTYGTTSGDISLGSDWQGGTAPTSTDIGLFNNTSTGLTDSVLSTAYTIGEIQQTSSGAVTINGTNTLTIDGVNGVGIDLSAATANLTFFTTTSGTFILGASQAWNIANGRTVDLTGTDGMAFGSNTITVNDGGTAEFNFQTPGSYSTSSAGAGIISNGSIISVQVGRGATTFIPATNFLGANTAITMNAGVMTNNEAGSTGDQRQTYTNLTIGAGAAQMELGGRGSSSGDSVGFAGLTRSAGGIVDFAANGSTNAWGATTQAFGVGSGASATNAVGFATYGENDWLKANGDNTINSAVTYTNDTWGSGDNTTVTVAGDTPSSGSTTNSLRYNNVGAFTVTLSGANILTTGGILVGTTAGANAETLTGGSLTSGNGTDLIFINNNTTVGGAGNLIVNSLLTNNGVTPIGLTLGVSTPTAVPGSIQLGGNNNTFTGTSYIDGAKVILTSTGAWNGEANLVFAPSGTVASTTNLGSLSIDGNNTIIGSLSTDALAGFSNPIVQDAAGAAATLTMNTSATATYLGTIQNGSGGGALGIALTGGGTETLAGSNTYTGATTVSGNSDLAFTTSIPSSSFTVGGGSTLNLSLVSAGATIGSGLTLSTGATSGQTATVLGKVTVNGGTLTTGAVGSTLSIGTLTLTSGGYNFAASNGAPAAGSVTTGTSGLVNVTAANGLTINGGTVNIVGDNFSSSDSYNVTYDLFQYSGTLNGSDTLTMGSGVAAGLMTAFGTSGGFVTLTITGTPLFLGNWITDGNGSWNSGGNWDVGSVPNSVSATANLGGAASTDANLSRTITLDAAQTIGTLNLTSPHGESYTLTAGSGGSLTFNNGGLGSALISVSGTHTLDSTVAVNLSSNLSISTGAGTDSLTIGGTVANTNTGTLAATVTVSGPGTVSLLGANTYGPASAGTVGTNINGGTVAVGANTSLGAGDVSVGGAVSVKSAAAGLNLANNFILGNSDSVAFDSNGNTLTVSGVVSDTSANGSLIAKSTIGGGTVVLANTETFGGSVTVNANTTLLLTAAQSYGGTTTISPTATLEVGNGGSTGALPATTTALTDSGALIFDRTDVNTITVANPISGNGSVTQNGVTGNTISLTGANSYSGGTTINGGEIQNGNATALGSGDLSIASGATLDLDGNGATIGNLNGAGTITSSAAGTMIVSLGNDNSSGLFTGTIANGTGTSVGISKFGSGTEQIGSGTTGGALYTGPTLVEQATLIIGGTSSITGSVDVGAENGTSALTIQDNAVIVDSTALEICSDDGSADGGEANGNPGGSTLLITGTANVTATGLAIGNVSGATPSRVGSSTITINDLATVTINGIFTLDNTEGTTGSTNVINLNGGILGVDNIVLGFANGTSQTAVIHLNGTTLEALASDPNASVFLPGVAGITVDVDSGGAIINTEGHTDTIATTLSAGTGGGLTKQGAGTLILTGAANYTGATAVNGGTLVVKGAMSATSGVTVAAGATLEADASINGADVVNDTAGGNIDGTGTIGGANITGGTLSPGLSTGSTVVGTLTSSNNISLSGNSTFAVRLGLTTGASTDVDSLNDTGGTFTLADTTTTLQINDTTVEYGATPGTLYDIIIGAVNAPVGVFGNALASGDTITTANNDVFAVYYDVNGSNVGTAGNDDVLELIAVPEPGTWASLLGGIGMLVAWQRTRRRRS